MRYVIEYFRRGECIATEICVGTLEATQQAARVGLKERRADTVRVVENDHGGTEIWSEGRFGSAQN